MKTFIEVERKCVAVVDHILFWVQRLWYVALLTFFSIYVGCNFDDCIEMTFFDDFDGDNIMFIFWLLLLVVPLVGKLEAFGVNVELKKEGDCLAEIYTKRFVEQENKEKGGES